MKTKRPIKLILHTDGVTKRYSELDFLNDKTFEIFQIDDFKMSTGNPASNINIFENLFQKFKLYTKTILLKLRFFSEANTDNDFAKITPWVISLRGHYTERTISAEFYRYLLSSLNLNNKANDLDTKSISVHYRLGDLITLKNKSPISAEVIVSKLSKIVDLETKFSITLHTEDPEIASKKLKSAGLSYEPQILNLTSVDVIRNCVSSDYFVGSNSKISLWIIKLRNYLEKR